VASSVDAVQQAQGLVETLSSKTESLEFCSVRITQVRSAALPAAQRSFGLSFSRAERASYEIRAAPSR